MFVLVHKVSHFFYDCNVKGRGSGYGIGSVGRQNCLALREAVSGKFYLPKTVGGGTVGAGTDELHLFVYTGLQSTAGACLCFNVFLTLAPEPSSDNLR